MHQTQVLVKMILSVECPFCWGTLLAGRVVVAFDMGIVWIGLATKDTG
jgi:hypothetical protein